VRSVHYARDSGNEYKHIGNNDDNNNFRDPDDLWVVIAAPRKPVSSGGALAREITLRLSGDHLRRICINIRRHISSCIRKIILLKEAEPVRL